MKTHTNQYTSERNTKTLKNNREFYNHTKHTHTHKKQWEK